MSKFAISPFDELRQDAPLAHCDVVSRQVTGANPVFSTDLLHELRQPLGVIDSLAYYLELTVTDEKSCPHLQRIRAMVAQASCILERASARSDELVLEHEFVTS
jgi:hypothetical protein